MHGGSERSWPLWSYHSTQQAPRTPHISQDQVWALTVAHRAQCKLTPATSQTSSHLLHFPPNMLSSHPITWPCLCRPMSPQDREWYGWGDRKSWCMRMKKGNQPKELLWIRYSAQLISGRSVGRDLHCLWLHAHQRIPECLQQFLISSDEPVRKFPCVGKEKGKQVSFSDYIPCSPSQGEIHWILKQLEMVCFVQPFFFLSD